VRNRPIPASREREIFIDNLLVRVHLIIEMSRPALRNGTLNSLFQVALYLPSDTCVYFPQMVLEVLGFREDVSTLRGHSPPLTPPKDVCGNSISAHTAQRFMGYRGASLTRNSPPPPRTTIGP
jgi:hypothetical protein